MTRAVTRKGVDLTERFLGHKKAAKGACAGSLVAWECSLELGSLSLGLWLPARQNSHGIHPSSPTALWD